QIDGGHVPEDRTGLAKGRPASRYDRDPPSGPALAHAVPPFIGSIRPTMARGFRGRKPAGAAASAPPSIPRSAAHVTRCPDASRPSAGGSLPKRRPHAATHRP